MAPTVVSRGNGDTPTPRVRRPGVAEDSRVVDVHVEAVGGVRIGLIHDLEHTDYRTDEDVATILGRTFGGRVDIAVSGHTHVPMVRGLADGTALVNPGSPTMPYGYLDLVGTIGFVDIDDSRGRYEVTILDLVTGQPQLKLTGPGHHPAEVGPRPVGGR
ncbi:MAG: metallophosphoesterase family protein [Acidimicrobiia bacterium]|nr:metallophosphoesterase family protein [Acidimicrobiia bacterium]